MAKAVKKIEDTSLNISEAVREAYAASGDSVKIATEKLFEVVNADQSFLRDKLPIILRAWCDQQVRIHVTKVRYASFTSGTPAVVDASSRGARLREAISAALMDYPLPGGKRLGDASGAEVANGAAVYREKADDMGRKASWLERIAQRVGDNIVSKVLSEDDLARLRENTDAQ